MMEDLLFYVIINKNATLLSNGMISYLYELVYCVLPHAERENERATTKYEVEFLLIVDDVVDGVLLHQNHLISKLYCVQS